MARKSSLAIVAAMIGLIGVAASGCKGGGSGAFARRSKSSTATNYSDSRGASAAGPALGRNEPAARFERNDPQARSTAASNVSHRPTKPQLTCPVSGKPLGVNSAPIVTLVDGEPIFVCSDACVKKVQRDPDKYLAKVRAEVARKE